MTILVFAVRRPSESALVDLRSSAPALIRRPWVQFSGPGADGLAVDRQAA